MEISQLKKKGWLSHLRRYEISAETSLRIFVRILLRPQLYEEPKEYITCATCSDVTSERNMEFEVGQFKNDEKFLSLSGIFDLILSATEE